MLALLCSGQGTQHRGMFHLTGAAPEAAAIFEQAEQSLHADPRAFVLGASATALTANGTAQILCVTQALAAAALLEGTLRSPCLVAGYSVGALGAWGVARMIDAGAALALAARRAALMDAASGPDDALAFVSGLGRLAVDRLAATHGAVLAIVNPGDSFILGGSRPQLERLAAAALAAGAKRAGLLAVHVAAHTPRMQAAAAAFETALRACDVRRPVTGKTLLSALNGAAVQDPQRGITGLAMEIRSTLNWAGCLEAMIERGASAFLELGPGRALAGMVEAAAPGTDARSIEDFNSRDGLLAWVRQRAP